MIQPLISICIPTFNRKEKLKRAIKSALNQDYSNFEVIVSDNSSTDGTEFYIRDEFKNEERLKYFKNDKNVGMVSNWRLCIERAIGKYYIILDDDNYFIFNSFITESVQLIENYDNLKIVFGNFVIRFKTHDKIVKYKLKKINKGLEIYGNYFDESKIPQIFFTILNRDFALRNNFYNEDIITHDVQSFLISMLGGDVGFVNRVVGVYDMTGDDNVVHSIGLKWKDYVSYNQKIIKYAIQHKINSTLYMKPFKRQMLKSYNYYTSKCNNKEDYYWLNTQIQNTYGIAFRFRLFFFAYIKRFIKYLLQCHQK
jgi:glycosyltransferase involved in cell wall biosynthesis